MVNPDAMNQFSESRSAENAGRQTDERSLPGATGKSCHLNALRLIPLGRRAVRVNELILGLGPLGNLYRPISDDQAAATLQAWWDRGLRSFDVAPLYGMGIAERRLGEFLRAKPRSEYTVSTKVGRPVGRRGPSDTIEHRPGGSSLYMDVPDGAYSYFAFDKDSILRSLADSLERLGLDHVDYVHVHDPEDHVDQAVDEAFPALAKLRAEGLIGAIGTGVNSSSVAVAMVKRCDLDCVMIAGRYSILDQEALRELLPLCAIKGVSVLVAGAFNSGFLADPKPGAPYQYKPCFDPDLIDRASRINLACERHGVSIKAIALQFPFGHEAVSAVVVGAGSAVHATELMDAFAQRVPRRLWVDLLEEGLLPVGTPVPG
jgi:D-threo-aldose 1-dehydrogenase